MTLKQNSQRGKLKYQGKTRLNKNFLVLQFAGTHEKKSMYREEIKNLRDIRGRIEQVSSYLIAKDLSKFEDVADWYNFLADIKSIQGNFNNDISFLATLMAKQYLEKKYGLLGFNAAEKAQGAPGLDIDVRLPSGERLVAEIKTTTPYKPNDLGSQQKNTFSKDFAKLADAKADIKLFFLTEQRTFDLMQKPKYRSQLSQITVVHLPSGEEFLA